MKSQSNDFLIFLHKFFTERTWEVLFCDYKEVYIDTVKDVKEKPRKAAAYIAGKIHVKCDYSSNQV